MSKRLYVIMILVAYGIPNTAYAGIPIISDLKNFIDEEVGKTVGAMTGAARIDAEKFLATAFKKHITPALTEIDRMILSGISETDSRVKARIEQIEVIVKETLREVRDNVKSLDRIQKELIKNITSLQGQIIDNTFCATDALRAKAKSDLDELRNSFKFSILDRFTDKGRRIEACRKELDFPSDPESWRTSSLYDLKKCVELRRLDEETNVDTIASTYLDLAGLASTARCVFRQLPTAADGKFTPEIVSMREKHNIWLWAQRQ